MTTNAIDLRNLVVASDSRWSTYHGNNFCWVDDTGFDKIAIRDFGGFICAGDAELIELWRNWFFQPVLSPIPPATERVAGDYKGSIDITLLAAKTGRVLFTRGEYLALEDYAYFTGTGKFSASECYATNGCAKRSVSTAASVDMHTGGYTMFWEIETHQHNLRHPPHNIGQMYREFETRGSAMNLDTKKVIPMSDYLATLQNSPATVKAAGLNILAPTGRGFQPWSDEEKQKLQSAVDELVRLQQETDTE